MANGMIKVDEIQASAQASVTISDPIKIDSIGVNASTTGIAVADPITLGTMTLLATVQSGAIEFDGTYFYASQGTSRYILNVPRRILPGELTLSYNNTTIFGVAAGTVADSTYGYALSLSAAWTKTVSAWAAGTGNGSLDTGAVAAGTTYHVFLIRKDSDGTSDILMSLSATSPTMPAGYTYFRRIGCFRTLAGGATIAKFYQHGNMFRFDAQVEDRVIGTAFANTNRVAASVRAPENCIGIFRVSALSNGTAYSLIAQAVEETDSAASATNFSIRPLSATAHITCEMQIAVDASRNIALRVENTAVTCALCAIGWIDPNL